MDIHAIVDRAIQIQQKYGQLNAKNGVEWKVEDFMEGFVGDVGDLSKLIMTKRGLRGSIPTDIDEKIAHELADCLWSVCVLAHAYDVNLETTFLKTMFELEADINHRLNA